MNPNLEDYQLCNRSRDVPLDQGSQLPTELWAYYCFERIELSGPSLKGLPANLPIAIDDTLAGSMSLASTMGINAQNDRALHVTQSNFGDPQLAEA